MSRSITGNRIAQDPAFVTQVSTGGTSATSINEASAADALNYPLKSQIGLPFGLAPLDANGLLAANLIPIVILSRTGVQITGPLSLGIGLTGTFTIVNYVSVRTYTVVALAGTATITGDTITYTAPLTTGQYGFTVNGITTNVTIVDPAQSPTVTGPSSLMENQTGTYTITNYDQFSTYTVTTNQGAVSRNGATITYTAPAGDGINTLGGGFSINSTAIAVQVTPPPTPTITGPTSFQINSVQTFTITNYTPPGSYYISVTGGTFTQNAGVITVTAGANTGNFALTVNGTQYAFTVLPPTISQPSILAPVNGASNLGPGVDFTASVFTSTLSGDSQAKSNWQLATDPGFTNPVQSSYNDTTNLTTWKVSNLAANSTYFVRVQYADIQNNLSVYSSASNFSTKTKYVATGISSRIYVGGSGQNGSSSIETINGTSTIIISIGITGTALGYNVGLNQDGTIAVLGGSEKFYVFQKQNGVWTQISYFNAASIGATYVTIYTTGFKTYYDSQFGNNVTMSVDGSTIVTGSPFYNETNAALSVFSYSSGTWNFITNVLTPQTYDNYSQNTGVSLSYDGSVIVSASAYKVYIYSKVANVITNIATFTLTPASYSQYYRGVSAINQAGNIVAAGNTNIGDFYIYQNVSGTWTQIGHLNNDIPTSMAFNADGTILAVGSISTSKVTIYQNQASNWVVIGTITNAGIQFASSISLNSDGTILVVGASQDNSTMGAAYVYQNQAGIWTQIEKITSSVANSYFGMSCGMTPDASSIIVGAPYEASYAGAAYIAT